MTPIFVASLLLTLTSCLPLAQGASDQNAAEQEVRRMENARRDALLRNDTTTLDRLLAPEFTRISSSTGDRVVAKAEELGVNAPGQRKVDSWEPSEVTVQIYGNVGLVTGSAEVTDTLGGEGRHIRFRYTHVWVKRDGHWQLVHRHTTRVATIKGPAPPP